jgi:dephospho-CoA kinase
VPIIDADELAYALVAPGEPALADIISEFGPEYLAVDGTLDRGKLRQLVFTEPASRHRLEAILHPLIRSNIMRLVSSVQAPYCVVSIPLLLETGQTDLVDRILVIDVPEALQLSRTAARDRRSMDEILPILETQADRSTRLAAADDVINNAGSLDELAAKVQALHKEYLSLSARN